jgi:hypothetical protein
VWVGVGVGVGGGGVGGWGVGGCGVGVGVGGCVGVWDGVWGGGAACVGNGSSLHFCSCKRAQAGDNGMQVRVHTAQ